MITNSNCESTEQLQMRKEVGEESDKEAPPPRLSWFFSIFVIRVI